MGIKVVKLTGDYVEFPMQVTVSTGNDRHLPVYEAESIVAEAYMAWTAPNAFGETPIATTGQIRAYVESMGYIVSVEGI